MKRLNAILFTVFAIVISALAIFGWLAMAGHSSGGREGLWSGVDVNVVEKFAATAGRQASPTLINTDQGDLLLFVFAAGGALGGFAAGYFWRKLITEKTKT